MIGDLERDYFKEFRNFLEVDQVQILERIEKVFKLVDHAVMDFSLEREMRTSKNNLAYCFITLLSSPIAVPELQVHAKLLAGSLQLTASSYFVLIHHHKSTNFLQIIPPLIYIHHTYYYLQG